MGVKWFAFSVLMVFMHGIKTVFPPFAIIFSLHYNSPSVMVASVLFFCFAQRWKMQSKYVNWISSSVLAIYLIHSGPFGSNIFFTPLKWMANNMNALTAFVCMSVFTLGFYALCILLDKVRILLCKPLNAWLVARSICMMQNVERFLFRKSRQ